MKPVEVETEEQFNRLISQAELAIADFWAPWCPPCLMLAPVIEELAERFKGKVLFIKVNVDKLPRLADRYGIQAIPTLIAFRRGEPAGMLVGLRPLDELEAWIRGLLEG